MSKIEVDAIVPQSGTNLTVGESGDTITVPSGATFDASNATTTLPATVVTTDGTQTLTNKTIDASQLVDASVANAKLANSSITLNGNSVSLGGSASIASGMFRNIIINGDMSIAQRSTSESGLTGSGFHTVDRYGTSINTAGTWTQSQSTDVPTGQGFSYSFKWDCTTADASLAASDTVNFQHKIEGQNLQYLNYGTSNAKSLTLSFWVKSNKTGTYTVEFQNHSPSTDRINCQNYTIDTADTWEKKIITIDGDTVSGKNFTNDNSLGLWCLWWLAAGSNFSSGTLQDTWGDEVTANRAVGNVNLADSIANEWYITGVQLEAGTTASDFEFLPHDVNLERCMRYYQKSYEIDDDPGTATTTGMSGSSGNTGTATSTSQIIESSSFLKPMRAEPTLTVYDGAGASGKVMAINYGTNEYNNETGSGFRVGSKYFAVQRSSGTAASSLAFHFEASAEL